MAENQPLLAVNSVPSHAAKVHWRSLRGGGLAALGLFAADVGYGLVAYSALGAAFADSGIVAAFLASIIGCLVASLLRGTVPLYSSPRPAQTLIFAALLADAIAKLGSENLASVVAVGLVGVVLAGVFQIAFALLGLGRIIRFTPLPVLAGFTNGVALSMTLSALLIIVGPVESLSAMLTISALLVQLLFVVSLLLLMALVHRLVPRVHWSLFGLVAGTILFNLAQREFAGASLGDLLPAVASVNPASGAGAPGFQWAQVFIGEHVMLVLAPALSMATLNSLESLVVANQQDLLVGTRSDARRVLLGQGVANIISGLFGGLPCAPSSSRQLVSRQLGATTFAGPLAFSAMMAGVMLATPWFVGQIPRIAVATLLLYMAWGLVDPWAKGQLRTWWRRDENPEYRTQIRSNIGVMLVVMSVAVTVNLVAATAVGVLLAMALFVHLNSRSIVSRVYFGDKRHSSVMRSLTHMSIIAEHGHNIVLVELSGPLFFGSGELLLDEVEALAKTAKYVILDFRQVATVDSSGAGAILRIARQLGQLNVALSLAGISREETNGKMISQTTGPLLPHDRWFEDTDLALEEAEDAVLATQQAQEVVVPGRTLSIDALKGLDDPQVALLLGYMDELVFNSGDAIFRRNDPGDMMYLLLAGKVEIRVPVKDGAGKRLVELRSGALFGEMAILRGAPRSANAIATIDGTEVLSLSQSALARLNADHPEIALTLMRNISIQLAVRLASVTEELRYALTSGDEAA